MGDEELARELVRGFVDDMPRQLSALAEAVGSKDASRLHHVAHSIKGAAGNIGGTELQKTAAKLELDSRAGNLTTADESLREISASFDRARSAMEDFCSED